MVSIRVLNARETIAALPDLCEVLSDCVNGGASVGFMLPFAPVDAEPFWRSVADAVANGDTIHVVAEVEGKVVGTVQIGLASKPNQPHRGDLMKLLVHRSARGLGLSRQLMEAVEKEAADLGRSLLVLDTATGSDAEAIYPRFGWERVGVIPDYALFPDGSYCGTTLFYKRIGSITDPASVSG
ncbi:GNAT family N-acetyltransferase [Rhizobium sp. RM]|uniref:GNAT family N-acetyltransferase n=1 Tax=Rhizobium sp. RM TaxID=2748079 RepID=UPI00110F0F5B|nr:GNAT family N-acetyltransferase [Rhizobium sp. RM]NWJ24562.1 GNAT family N-acetyltransferase [Rhizobium sp. RM]TMV16371.1 GNAT family N-acetyltransferase [Rhizobium sp. Td3]